jgi:hypothetical protein
MANNPLTLVTAAPYLPDTLAAGVVELFATNSSVLNIAPLEYSDDPTSYSFMREKSIADAEWRKFNADVSTTHSELEKAVENIYPLAIKIPIDNALKKGASTIKTQQTISAVKGMASKFTKSFFSGDNSTTENCPDGLNVRLTNYSQTTNVATNGLNVILDATNAKILISKLQNMVGEVDEPATPRGTKVWLMSLSTKIILDEAILKSGYFLSTNNKDVAESPLPTFCGIPIVVITRDASGAEILGFSETEGTSTSVCASIYLVNFSPDDGVHIASPSGETDILNPTIKEYTTGGIDYYHLELSLGIVMRKIRSAYRLRGIKRA